jgi:23S rRNA (cytosine1962-C5)-methyltransferase
MKTFETIFSKVPQPATKNIAMRVTAGAQRAIHQGHPWVFDNSITDQSHDGYPGDLAVIFDSKRRFLAVGLYDPTSPIRVRILEHRKPTTIDETWFYAKLTAAAEIRSVLNDSPFDNRTNGYRLVHGENDGLPGLIIDRYDTTMVLKLYSPAWIVHLREVCNALSEVYTSERLVLRLNRSLKKQPEYLFGLFDGLLLDGTEMNGPILFQENGLTFEAEPVTGHKTGFYLDQRENRARVESLSNGKSVLNVFAYNGGFSVYAARGGATRVVSVDLSVPALEAAERNFSHNLHFANVVAVQHETMAQDAFDVLENMAKDKQVFDMVILDPPMFAQNQSQIESALTAYRRLTHLGLGVLKPGGILVQASCSSRVDADQFFTTIHQAANEIGRPLRELERTAHALDHPISFKEGAYLKCLFAEAA